MKKLIPLFALLIFALGFGQTPITDSNFHAAITNCLTTNPQDGMCSESEYGAMPDWDVSQVTDMSDAFRFETNFNADISAWDVSSVTDFGGMFYQARAFNQDISSWNVSNATSMADMFNNARVFNQDISVWNVSNVTHMNGMFYQNYTFNIDLSAWDVSNVTNMAAMFQYALAFNQNLSSWNISNVNDLNSFGEGSLISVENYDALLTAWSSLTLQQGVTFSSTTLQYCTAGDARQSIIDNFGWSITDAGLATGCSDSLSTTDFSNSIIMYPSPVKNILNIDGLVVKDVVIYSVLGKAVLKINKQNTIDVGSLSKGIYFIKVSDGINASTKKFIKE